MLRTVSRYAIKLGYRQFQLAATESSDILNCTFTIALATNNQCATVILHGAGENLRG